MQHSEASTEEILGIIKRVIERENREVAADEKRKRESVRFATALRPSGRVENGEALITGSDADEVLDLGEAELVVDSDHAAELADRDDSPAGSDKAGPQAEPETLTSTAARKSVNDSFAALAMLAQGDAEGSDAPSESPLEGMVRDMVRPMLAEWLDTNLPAVVERLVREEIDRIAGKAR
ncbi:DUF2497 domain-containing protein [Aurantiacibacter suaedae]|uniref:DUF2497 domain-containing protein n=1 Tax=Aurantiacibacter suaedae TaxID=2545755 RepID=UPI0010F4BA4B|nr:DUF2497 domain-containing protein [Aurantiacibacter suaedae]